MKLLFKATKDGSSSYCKKLNKKVQQLILIKTTKSKCIYRARNYGW